MNHVFSEVQEVLNNYKFAIEERNVEKFLQSYSENVHLFDTWGAWECCGKTEWKKGVEKWFNELADEHTHLKVTISEAIKEECESVAFVHCAITFAAYLETSPERIRQITNRFTFGLRKTEGSWEIIHEHSSLPIDPETGKGMFDLR